MSIVNKILLIIAFFIVTSCSINKNKKFNSDDYKIINSLLDKYQDTLFIDKETRKYYTVYEDSLLIFNRVKTKAINSNEIIYKYLDKKFKVVSDAVFFLKKFNSSTDSIRFNKRKHKFVIDDFYYDNQKRTAYLNYNELVYYDTNFEILNESTHFSMQYKKVNGKWIELGNFNRKLN